ncbi:Uma2 family endonuclease [Thermopolyspora sp. NPDC052614]|uniref:Uma2 family endonuclease n=1 Tax=Thermopolyspora sp. NPDC052614 TaxID=3155682 RepID=UPI00343BAF3B
MSEGVPEVSVVKAVGIDEVVLPAGALDLWDGGELHDLLHLPHDGTKIEIIDGTIVVTAAPLFGHNSIGTRIVKAISQADNGNTSWEVVQNTGVLLRQVLGGYSPDLVVMESAVFDAASEANVRRLTADEIEMVVEITSKHNAVWDRKAPSDKPTKWNGYARMEIPYYLLVDRDPKIARVTLYSIPDRSVGAYLNEESWAFGETIHLPEPFGSAIPTDRWRTWE